MRVQNLDAPAVSPVALRVGGRGFAARALADVLSVIKASRPGFWLTTIWFYLLPLGSELPLRSPAFWLGLLYVILPLGLIVYGANDLTDELTDRFNPRKGSYLFGARPTPTQIAGMPLRIAVAQVPFLCVFWFLVGARVVPWFAAIVAVTTFYNRFAKNRPLIGTLAQVGYLSVFFISFWLNGVPLAPWPLWVFGALFAMHSHLIGEIMDIEPDGAAARRTTAVAFGARATKLLIAAVLPIEAVLALSVHAKPWLPFLLVAGSVGFILDAALLWRNGSYPTSLIRLFFITWNLFLLLEIAMTLWKVLPMGL